MSAVEQVKQWSTGEDSFASPLRLVPPLAEDFGVYGDAETQERARRWALDNRYLLVTNVPACAHGLYGMPSCPGRCRGSSRFDHPNIWYGGIHEGPPSLFLLSHNYSAAEDGCRDYAEAHGLDLRVGNYRPDDPAWLRDDWYAPDRATAFRMTAKSNLTTWPLEPRLLWLNAIGPVTWPGDEDGALR